MDDEVKGDGNSYDFGARMYDSSLGKFLSIDGFTNKFPHYSPYIFAGNTPIWAIDQNGDSVVRFNSDGNFIGFFDDGLEGWTYEIGTSIKKYDKKTKKTSMVWVAKQKGQFNDVSTDIQAIKNGRITMIKNLSNEDVEKMIDKSGVKKKFNGYKERLKYAYNQGAGKMDYGIQNLYVFFEDNSFYVRNGVAHNIGDIGNYMWGRGMAELGIALETALKGAHFNNAVNGRSQKVKVYDFGPGTYGSAGVLDSKADQNAISRGYNTSEAGKRNKEVVKRAHSESTQAVKQAIL
jgi:RHS repeat-associated protein